MSIFSSNDIENVGEVGSVADEFKDCCELLFLKTVNIVDSNNDGLVYSWFGIHEKVIDRLLKLNEDLDSYKDALLALYFQVEGMSENSHKWGEVELKYEKLKSDNARYITEHDKLTGKIDKEVE